MITMGKKYQTRDGRAVRILATDVKANSYSVVGIVTEYAGGREFISEWTATGESISRMYGTHNDLIPVPTKHEGWMVIVQKADPCGNRVYPDRIFAEIACSIFAGEHVTHVTWEG